MSLQLFFVHPRSLSTCFENIIRQRNDFKVFHELFACSFFKEEREETYEDDNIYNSYEDVKKTLFESAEKTQTFNKDICNVCCEEIIKDFDEYVSFGTTFSFLIRHPAKTLVSYYRTLKKHNQRVKNTDTVEFPIEDVGYHSIERLVKKLQSENIDIILVNADDLQRDPHQLMQIYCEAIGCSYIPESLEWEEFNEDNIPSNWKSFQTWHDTLLSSTSVVPLSNSSSSNEYELDLNQFDSQDRGWILEYYTEILEIYERLNKLKLAID